ncbi:Type II transport protein GspH [Geoalkalibacter ferrihydriticus]|uniref:Type II secretion system protein H n=2 Tax=Geoalkalibacter ferrihydriticus TaxID=392333 RepID=A0A0C2HW00_9BACT|nr:GspH/FimT family pseudopilin [Geoalkalibacter ferrihydriticus]KIH76922.1 hypothetical protein GFER_07490 [Geoalkalibacter ferrihydriticus DSM 17813]SDL44281.1 Type II transport protein GspH [Geoalkalibacter ferrihydriticus]
MLTSRGGFALIEALVVLGLMGILLTIATPYYQVFMQNAAYRSAAREIASVMRQARAEAATKNREYRVEIGLKEKHYGYQLSPGGTGWRSLSPLVRLGEWDGNQCRVQTATLDLDFFPNGTASRTAGICVLNPAGERRFLVTLTSRTTGHVEVRR